MRLLQAQTDSLMVQEGQHFVFQMSSVSESLLNQILIAFIKICHAELDEA
jgi:hypothetical protein